jgi:hypothetical protein
LLKLPFKQSREEVLLSAAATLLLRRLEPAGTLSRVAELCGPPQYGYTASASWVPTGPRFVRITDLQRGVVTWSTVPYCDEPNSSAYDLTTGDILVARSGSVGKSFFVTVLPERSVFASYLIRLRATHLVVPEYLYWAFQTHQFWSQVLEGRRGSAMGNINAETLKRLQFVVPEQAVQLAVCRFMQAGEEVELPNLPSPLDERRRIVARLELLARKIDQVSDLQRDTSRDCDLLLHSILRSDNDVTATPMRELVQLRRPDVEVQSNDTYQFAGVMSFGRGVFRGPRKTGAEFSYKKLTRVNAGDFVYPKLMAWEGALGVVPPECDGCVVSPEFPVFSVNREKVFPEVLHTHFTSPTVWRRVSGASTG